MLDWETISLGGHFEKFVMDCHVRTHVCSRIITSTSVSLQSHTTSIMMKVDLYGKQNQKILLRCWLW